MHFPWLFADADIMALLDHRVTNPELQPKYQNCNQNIWWPNRRKSHSKVSFFKIFQVKSVQTPLNGSHLLFSTMGPQLWITLRGHCTGWFKKCHIMWNIGLRQEYNIIYCKFVYISHLDLEPSKWQGFLENTKCIDHISDLYFVPFHKVCKLDN